MTNQDKPAFPIRQEEGGYNQNGLTKREYFAAMAMQGIIAGLGAHLTLSIEEATVVAMQSKQFADKLLNVLES